MDKELELEKIFYLVQIAAQSAQGNEEPFSLETEQHLDNVYHRLKNILGIE